MSYQPILDLLARYFQSFKQVLTQKALIRLLAVWTPLLLMQTWIIQDLDSQGILYKWVTPNKEIGQDGTGFKRDPKVTTPIKPPIIETPPPVKDSNPWDWIVPIGIGAGAIALCFATGLCIIP